MAKSPIIPDIEFVSLDILINGRPIKDSTEIVSIETFQHANTADRAIIKIRDENQFNHNFENLNSNTFKLENDIEIKLGYNSKNITVFKGKIIKKSAIVNIATPGLLQVTCEDHAHDKLTKRQLVLDDNKVPVLELTYGHDIKEAQLDLDDETPKMANGYLRFQGSANINVSDYVSIEGFGKAIPKRAIVSGIEHEVEEGYWFTTAYVGHNS